MKIIKLTEGAFSQSFIKDERYVNARNDYRKFANLEEGVAICKENFDEWALAQTCVKHNYPKYDLREKLLTEAEDISLDQAARQLDAEAHEVESKGELETILDRALDIALDMQEDGETGDFPNVMIESPAGFGKSSIVRQWAKKNNINLYEINLGQAGPEHVGGIIGYDAENPNFSKPLSNRALLDGLSRPRSVLFLDEYNRSKNSIRGTILDVVESHLIPDGSSPTGKRFMPDLLFTIGAMNPNVAGYRGVDSLDNAEKTRFVHHTATPNPFEHLTYLKKFYTEKIKKAQEKGDEKKALAAQGRLALAETILSSDKFHYTTPAEEEKHDDEGNAFHPTNYRSFKKALDICDGTKADLLRVWNSVCDYTQKSMIEDILHNYVDIKDKATAALEQESESPVFAKVSSNRDKLRARFSELNI